MVVRMKNCCCCIPLKAGVVVLSILWLVNGLYLTITDITRGLNLYSGFGVPRIIINIVMTLGAAFGLYVLSCANTSKMLLIYSKIAYFYAAIDTINCIAVVIVLSTYRETYLSTCSYTFSSSYSYTSYRSTRVACAAEYDGFLRMTIVLSVISIILSVYFAMVVAAYANRRKEKEEARGLPQATFVQPNGGLPQTTYVQPNGGLPAYVQPGLPQTTYVQPNGGLPTYVQPGLPQTTYAQPHGDLPKIIYVQTLPDLPTNSNGQAKSGFPNLPMTSHHGQAKEDLPVLPITSHHGQAKEDLPDLPKTAHHGQASDQLPDLPKTSHHGQAKDDLPDLPKTLHHGQAKDDLPPLPKNG